MRWLGYARRERCSDWTASPECLLPIAQLQEAIRSLDDASYKAFLESCGSDEEEREEEVEETFVPEAAHGEEEEDEEGGGWDAEPAEDAAEPLGLEEGIEAEGLDAIEGLDELGSATSSKRTKRSLERAVAAAMSLRRLNETDASALANGNGLRETMRCALGGGQAGWWGRALGWFAL